MNDGLADERQVLRYSALLFGVFYGFSHQRTIYSNQKAAHVEHEYKQKESLIQKAKLEYAKKQMPPQSETADGGGKLLVNYLASGPLRKDPSNVASRTLTDALNSHHGSNG